MILEGSKVYVKEFDFYGEVFCVDKNTNGDLIYLVEDKSECLHPLYEHEIELCE